MTRRDEGFILVAMIWIVAILAVLTLGFAHRALIDQRAAAVSLDRGKAQYFARGAVNYAVADMRNKAFMEALVEQARAQLPGGAGQRVPGVPIKVMSEGPNLYAQRGVYSPSDMTDANRVSYAIIDAESRISLNTAPEEVLDHVEGLGMRTISAIMRRRGGELAPEDRNLFLSVEEVRSLEDIDVSAWEGGGGQTGLRDLFTVYGDGRINVNTASREVLASIPDLDQGVIDRILEYRRGDDGKLGTGDDRQFRSLETMSAQLAIDPATLAPVTRYCTFESRFFTITGFATQRQGKVRATAQAVVAFDTGNATVLSWSEGEFGPQIAH